jgi:hypothetical protein
MAGQITISTLRDDTGVLAAQNGMAGIPKAWVNFNGTLSGTITPRASFNVVNITKNATGDYTLNFTTSMTNTNYAISASAARNNAGDVMICGPKGNASTYSASAVRIQTQTDGGTFEDSPIVGISVFSS